MVLDLAALSEGTPIVLKQLAAEARVPDQAWVKSMGWPLTPRIRCCWKTSSWA